MKMQDFDPKCIVGKLEPVDQVADVVVVGAGKAGMAAAIAASNAGCSVVLIDENPLGPGLMGMDVPLHFGGRMDGSVQHANRSLQAVLSARPDIAVAYDLGIDVRLGWSALGCFLDRPGSRSVACNTIALANEDTIEALGFRKLILATGSRDFGLAFPGWQTQGVMGANAFVALTRTYRCFNGNKVAILGSGAAALSAGRAAIDHSVEIVAFIETEGRDGSSLVEFERNGIPVIRGDYISSVGAGPEGLRSIIIRRADGSAQSLDCDTLCLSLGLVPSIELHSTAGCRVEFNARLGGYIPSVDEHLQTSVPDVYSVGLCNGTYDENILSEAISEQEGQIAGYNAASSLNGVPQKTYARQEIRSSSDPFASARGWIKITSDKEPDTIVCQCEEVTLADIREIRPPTYLSWQGDLRARGGLQSLSDHGPLNPDQVKRLTRAGMGYCQGRRCREQTACLLQMEEGAADALPPLATYRIPVRPLPLKAFNTVSESPSLHQNWSSWMGPPDQYKPFWELNAEPISVEMDANNDRS